MSLEMQNFIKEVNNHLSGNVIILGGWSKFYNGYNLHYDKNWVDVSITPESVDLISKLGKPLEINGGHVWGKNIINQFVVMCGERKKRKYLDVFVSNKLKGYKEINNLKILTPQANIKWHQEAYDMLQYEWLSEKISNLKNLYNI